MSVYVTDVFFPADLELATGFSNVGFLAVVFRFLLLLHHLAGVIQNYYHSSSDDGA